MMRSSYLSICCGTFCNFTENWRNTLFIVVFNAAISGYFCFINVKKCKRVTKLILMEIPPLQITLSGKSYVVRN